MKRATWTVLGLCLLLTVAPVLAQPQLRPLDDSASARFEVGGGFTISVDQTPAEKRDGIMNGTIVSPWGESMAMAVDSNDERVKVVLDNQLELLYELTGQGEVAALHVRYDGREASTAIGDRAQAFAHGTTDKSFDELFDLSAFSLLQEGANALHSKVFYDEFQKNFRGTAAPAGCFGSFLHCAGAIGAYAGNIIGLIGGCATLNPACIGLIIIHPGVSIHVGIACGDYMTCGGGGGGGPEI